MTGRSSKRFSRFNLSRVVPAPFFGLMMLLYVGLVFQAACTPTSTEAPPASPKAAPPEATSPQEEKITETASTAATSEEIAKVTATPIPLPTSTPGLPTMDIPLPRGIVQEPAEFHYGPKHPAMALLPAGTEFVLLGKNRGEEKLDEGTWFRVQIRNGPETGRVGWIKTAGTSPDTLAVNTNAIPSPPSCARALANSLDDFQEADRSVGTMGVWKSTHTGDTAFVIDIYRQIAGELTPKLTFTLQANGKRVAPPEEIKPTRKSFIWRGLVVHADLKKGDKVRLGLQAPDGTIPGEVSWFVSAYSVPDGCEFNY